MKEIDANESILPIAEFLGPQTGPGVEFTIHINTKSLAEAFGKMARSAEEAGRAFAKMQEDVFAKLMDEMCRLADALTPNYAKKVNLARKERQRRGTKRIPRGIRRYLRSLKANERRPR